MSLLEELLFLIYEILVKRFKILKLKLSRLAIGSFKVKINFPYFLKTDS